MRPPFVFITNKSGHDFSPATKFGELRFLTVGSVDKYNINTLYGEIIDGLEGSTDRDFLMVSSLTVLNVVAAAILARKYGKLNLLLYRNGDYIERNLNIDSLLEE